MRLLRARTRPRFSLQLACYSTPSATLRLSQIANLQLPVCLSPSVKTCPKLQPRSREARQTRAAGQEGQNPAKQWRNSCGNFLERNSSQSCFPPTSLVRIAEALASASPTAAEVVLREEPY